MYHTGVERVFILFYIRTETRLEHTVLRCGFQNREYSSVEYYFQPTSLASHRYRTHASNVMHEFVATFTEQGTQSLLTLMYYTQFAPTIFNCLPEKSRQKFLIHCENKARTAKESIPAVDLLGEW